MLIEIQEINGPRRSEEGRWQEIELIYTENGEGRTRTKNLVSFGDGKPVFDALATGEYGPGDTAEIQLKKSGKYWNWVSLEAASGRAGSKPSKSGAAAAKPAASSTTKTGGWETPEERYKRNLTICRQNALTNSVGFHTNNGDETSVLQVLEVAQTFFEWTTQSMVKEEDVAEELLK